MLNYNLLGPDAYKALRYKVFVQLEGDKTAAYLDTKNLPTIGIGFDLTVKKVRDKVFKAMGIDNKDQAKKEET